MTLVAIVFWASIGLILYAHIGYPVLLGLLAWLRDRTPRTRARFRPRVPPDDELPSVSVIVAAYAEQEVILIPRGVMVVDLHSAQHPRVADEFLQLSA